MCFTRYAQRYEGIREVESTCVAKIPLSCVGEESPLHSEGMTQKGLDYSEYETEQWRLRVEGTREAQRRTRSTFAVITLVAVAVFIAEFNALLSWHRFFAMAPVRQSARWLQPFPGDPGDVYQQEEIAAAVKLTEDSRRELANGWIRSTFLNFSAIGVSIGISDLSVLGSGALYILSIWFFFCARRENHSIGGLLIDSLRLKDPALCHYVFHGVLSQTVFNTISREDRPVMSLVAQPVVPRAHKRVRGSLFILIMMPPLTIFLILLLDLISLGTEAVFRYPHAPLRGLLQGDQSFQMWWREIVAALFCAFTWANSRKVLAYFNATQNLLVTFCEQLTGK